MGTKYDSTITPEEDETYELATSMPIYGSIKYSYKINNTTSAYVQGKLGYAFMFDGKAIDSMNDRFKADGEDASVEVVGKMYTGIAVGAEMGNYNLGLSYDITEADMELKASGNVIKKDFTYSKVALSVGYKFGK